MVEEIVEPKPNWLLRISIAIFAIAVCIYVATNAAPSVSTAMMSPKERAAHELKIAAAEYRKFAEHSISVIAARTVPAARGVFTGSDNGLPSTKIACGQVEVFNGELEYKRFIMAPDFSVVSIEPEDDRDPAREFTVFKANWERLCSIPGPYR